MCVCWDSYFRQRVKCPVINVTSHQKHFSWKCIFNSLEVKIKTVAVGSMCSQCVLLYTDLIISQPSTHEKPWIRSIWRSSSVIQPQACSNHPVNCCGFLFTWQSLRLQGSGSAGEAKAGNSLNTLPNVTNSSEGLNKTVCNRKSSFRGKNKGCHYPQSHNHFTTMCFRFHVLDNQFW